MNHLVNDSEYITINCAIEESALNERKEGLLSQDEFVRDHIKKDDILIVSVGGNDVALKPSETFLHILFLFLIFHGKKLLLLFGTYSN